MLCCHCVAAEEDGNDGEEWEDVDNDEDEECDEDEDTAMEEEIEEPSGDASLDKLRALIKETGPDALFPPLDGTALYATLCKINHSCDPNVLVSYTFTQEHGLIAQLHALRPIQVGEELLQSYVDQNVGTSRPTMRRFPRAMLSVRPPSQSTFFDPETTTSMYPPPCRPGQSSVRPCRVRILLHMQQMPNRSQYALVV